MITLGAIWINQCPDHSFICIQVVLGEGGFGVVYKGVMNGVDEVGESGQSPYSKRRVCSPFRSVAV